MCYLLRTWAQSSLVWSKKTSMDETNLGEWENNQNHLYQCSQICRRTCWVFEIFEESSWYTFRTWTHPWKYYLDIWKKAQTHPSLLFTFNIKLSTFLLCNNKDSFDLWDEVYANQDTDWHHFFPSNTSVLSFVLFPFYKNT